MTISTEHGHLRLPIHTIDTAPEASRPILEGLEGELGLLPNLAAAIAASPALLTAFDGGAGRRPWPG